MADPMRIRAQAAGDKTTVRVLMSHEMETGQRKDSAGKPIPAWFIQEVTAAHNGKTVMTAEWGPSVAKNPFMQFNVKGAKAGDKITISWVDNKGETRTDEATIASFDKYKKITAQLSDPRKLTDAQARELIKTGKPFYYITGSLHSSEAGSPEMLVELAFRLAVEESPFIKTIRDNSVVVITPVAEVGQAV